MDGKLFNQGHVQSRTKTLLIQVVELQYADNAGVCAHSETELQVMINVFVEAHQKMGLALMIQKRKVLRQQAPGTQLPTPAMQLHDNLLETLVHFPYFEGHLSQTIDIDEEIQYRLKCAS